MKHAAAATDPSLPSYCRPEYIHAWPQLRLLEDAYADMYGCKGRYLLREQKEPDWAYELRLQRSVFNNRLRPAVDSNAGLLTAFEIEDAPPSLDAALDNVDMAGSDYKAFFHQADIMALRDGYCYVFVDYPPADPAIETEADRRLSARRPWLKLIDRRQIPNWFLGSGEGGRPRLDSVTIATEEQMPDGEFGVTCDRVYHQFVRLPDGTVEHRLWAIELINGKETKALLATGQISLDEVPLVCYPFTSRPFNTDNPPFLKLAELNVKLFRKESSLDETEFRVNSPTVWRKWPGMVPERPDPIVFGPTWVIEIPEGGDVGVLEVSGQGIADLRQSIEVLKADIDAETLAFLSGSRVQRTATEAFLDSAQIQASLAGMARDKANAIRRIIDYWVAYTGEVNEAQIQMDHSLLEMPLDPQEMQAMMGLWQSGAISHKTLLEMLKMGRQFPPDFDVEDELERIAEELQLRSQPVPIGGAALDSAQAIALPPAEVEAAMPAAVRGETEDDTD